MSLFKNQKYDRVLLLAVLALVLIGVVMITSIGVPKSIRLSAPDLAYGNCADAAVDCYLILKKHVVRAALGLVAMLIAWKMPYKAWKTLAPLFYIAGVALLVYVLAAGDENGTFAKSWINLPALPFIDSVQPSEIAKLGLIFYLSYFLSEKISYEKLQDFKEGFLKFALIAGLIIGLIVSQPDVGSAIILAAIAGVIYYIAGANIKHIAVVLGIGAFFALIAFSTQDHIQTRVQAFFQPVSECDGEDYCWQTKQANIAIGSGGFWGKGLTQGIQKSFWLPQAVDDFIFAATAEELGFVRMSLIVLLYATIAYRGFQIASHAPNKFSMLLATGISTWITIQAFVNIMVNTALFPITGITLPFMSYGGSSMVMTLFAIGVLLNISQSYAKNEYSADRRRYGRARYTQPRYSGRYSRL
ncbi:cell division protein FtsW [Candidatus Peregrinibacteria bacterium]|nr:MAG: cell division protein FtsW [Candidatus Peregrinibacteria bacterium]